MYIIKNNYDTLCRSDSGFTFKTCADCCQDIVYFKDKCNAEEISKLATGSHILPVCRIKYCGLFLCYDGKFSLYDEDGGWFTEQSLKEKVFLPADVEIVW